MYVMNVARPSTGSQTSFYPSDDSCWREPQDAILWEILNFQATTLMAVSKFTLKPNYVYELNVDVLSPKKLSLLTHQKTHTGEKLCTDWERTFRQRPELITYQKIHSAEKPY